MSALPARMALGAAMLYHGVSKLHGEGRAHTTQMFEGLGLRPPRFWAIATGIAETFAGLASLLGIATRPAALAIAVTQGVAIRKVHGPRGYSNVSGGMEYNLALVAIALGLLIAGPGRLSTHELVERRLARRKLWQMVARHPQPLVRALQLAL
jgi:putative oxidoreductase